MKQSEEDNGFEELTDAITDVVVEGIRCMIIQKIIHNRLNKKDKEEHYEEINQQIYGMMYLEGEVI